MGQCLHTHIEVERAWPYVGIEVERAWPYVGIGWKLWSKLKGLPSGICFLLVGLLWLVAYVVRVHVMMACGGTEDDTRWRCVSSFTLLVAWPSRKAPPVPVEKETVWAPWLVWVPWKRENCMGIIAKTLNCVRPEVVMAVVLKIAVFWDVRTCCLRLRRRKPCTLPWI
jgi:hypothetical protein